MKFCKSCGLWKSLDDFYRQSAKKYGISYTCKACNNKAHDEARRRRAAKAKAKKQAEREANAEAIAAAKRAGSAKRTAEWRRKNPEKTRAKAKAYYVKNWEKEQERHKRYAKENPLKMAELCHRRRARQLSGGKFSKQDIERIGQFQKWQCACCRTSIKDRFHIDHVIALVNGGMNTADNIQLLCPHCNHSKAARDPIEFMQSRGFLL